MNGWINERTIIRLNDYEWMIELILYDLCGWGNLTVIPVLSFINFRWTRKLAQQRCNTHQSVFVLIFFSRDIYFAYFIFFISLLILKSSLTSNSFSFCSHVTLIGYHTFINSQAQHNINNDSTKHFSCAQNTKTEYAIMSIRFIFCFFIKQILFILDDCHLNGIFTQTTHHDGEERKNCDENMNTKNW